MRRFLFLCGCAMAIGSSAIAVVNAQDINLNIVNGAPQAGLVGPAGGLGETWNQFSSVSASNLLDTTGNITSVGYTSSGNAGWGGPDTWGNPSLAVLRDGLRNFGTGTGNAQQLIINGLNEGDIYDVWILSSNNTPTNQRVSGQWSTANIADTIGNQLVDNTLDQNGTTFVEGNNYVFFDNVVVNMNGELVFNGNSFPLQPTFDTRLPFNGFQLVADNTVVPEPASIALWSLLGLGLAGFGYTRFRRK